MPKILVVGDSMLDRYWFGEASRLSQEAPVPVVKMIREEQRAGAAANVAMNCKAMGADTCFVSVVGNDAYGENLLGYLYAAGIDAYCHTDSIRTTQKLRVIGKQQQIVRIDFEETPDATSAIRESYNSLLGRADVVVFSDYGKGTLVDIQLMINDAKQAGKTVLVDPKGHDYTKYRGADLVKPNVDEMKSLVGGWSTEEELSQKAQKLLIDGGFKAILLTRSSDGMTLFTEDDTVHIRSDAKQVYDVSGAGDTAIAAFAVALTKGYAFPEAMRYANKAAGIVVAKFGTAVATESEVFPI
jgi:rfaE bifunctional protein kinase chain/domain